MLPSTLTTSDHIELLGVEAVRFASSLTDADLDATVVTCPDWTVRDLVSHVGGLHRWSTELVANGILAETWRSSLPLDYPDDTAPLEAWCEWLTTGAADACRTMRLPPASIITLAPTASRPRAGSITAIAIQLEVLPPSLR